MKLQIASDLHLEFYEYDSALFQTLLQPIKDIDCLILAGDIGYPEETITKLFLAWCCDNWSHVVWIMGNHEYYTRRNPRVYTMAEKEQITEDYMVIHPNLSVLNTSMDDTFKHLGFRILGTTLWTDADASQAHELKKLNDFKMIRMESTRPFQICDWKRLHIASRAFLQQELDDCEAQGLKAIVVSHYLPTYKMILEQYQGSDLNCGFAAHADDLIDHPATGIWVCGHSHGQSTISIKKTNGDSIQCILNAKGYPNENSTTTYDPVKWVEL